MLGVPIEEPVLEARQSEEVVLLFEVLHGAAVDRAAVGNTVDRDQFVVGVVLLARHAVLPGEGVELDVAGVVAPLQDLFDRLVVARFGGADEVVVRNVEPLPRGGELRSDLVGERLWGRARLFGGLLDLQAVFVGAGEIHHLVAQQAMPPREGVADDRRVRVAQMRLGVHVIDRGGHVEPTHSWHAT